MLEFTRLKNNLRKNTEGFKTTRLALLCDSSSQHLCLAIRGYGIEQKINFEIFQSNYGEIEQEVVDEVSELYHFSPQFVLISQSSHRLIDEFYSAPLSQRSSFALQKLKKLQALLSILQQRSRAVVFITNFQELDDKVFGNYANNVQTSFLYQVRLLNLMLMEEAQKQHGIFINDVQSLTMEVGITKAIDHKVLLKADLIWSLEFLPLFAKSIVTQIETLSGHVKKCMVLDLDNTLWGGILGDDGMEGIELGELGNGKAYTRFQKWIKELKQRGIIICICSKNYEATAKEVFTKHPDMILREDDISVFAINWNNKVDNIHFIRKTLNIGFDAMVFIDDNPFERGMVKEGIPGIVVPELPADPVEYLPYLQSLNLFETASISEEDEQRTLLYKQEAERITYQEIYKDENEYLDQLQMNAEIRLLDPYTIPRAAQLSQRSNQFNLRTIRYSEAELKEFANAENYYPFVVSLNDRFGKYGIICFVLLKKVSAGLFIEGWMMSCRVLKRHVERFVLNHIVSIAKENNISLIVGEYIASSKNDIVKDHYNRLGFKQQDGRWYLSVNEYVPKKAFIFSVSKENYHKVSGE